MNTFISCIAATALFAASQAEAEAGRVGHDRVATVYVGDLDLGTRRGAQELYERIDYAARTLCASERVGARRRCIESAVKNAVERVSAPLLTAIHLQQSEQVARL